MTPPIFHPIFWRGVFPFHQIAHVGVSRSINLKVINQPWNYFRSMPTYVITVPETLQTDRTFGRLRSSKVIDFGTNRKRACDFLLVRHSNLGPILHRFGQLQAFCAPGWPHPYSILILGVFSLHQIARIGVSASRSLKLFGREIIFEVFQPMWLWYLNVTVRRTDRQTTYCGITALCVASRGKKILILDPRFT